MRIYRYSGWDSSQDTFDLDADKLMDELGRSLMSDSDLPHALRQMQQRGGISDSQGKQLPSLEELLQRLREGKQSQLEKYNLSSVLDDIRQKLDDVLETERQGIQRKLDEAKQKAEEGASGLSPEMQQEQLKAVEDMAAQSLEKLDGLPPDIGGQIEELKEYDFMDEEAERQFQELVDMLKEQATESRSPDLAEKSSDTDASTLDSMKNMDEALNQMLEQRLGGEEPDFDRVMEQFGDSFGSNPPQSLDEMIERQQKLMAPAQSLLESLSPGDREQLSNLLKSVLDEATQHELGNTKANLETLQAKDRLQKHYPFSGEASISYTEALKLMGKLQKMDELETELEASQHNRSLDVIDEKLVKELMGDEAAAELDALRDITRVLEEAGYISLKGGKYALTPRAMRKIGQKALEDIFSYLKKDHLGGHNLNLKGSGGERLEETKKFEFSDDFQLHLQKTIMNSLRRGGRTLPVKLSVEDFEVFKTEALTQSATVLMLDLSLSMPIRGNFEAAKRVTIALDGLIRSKYPKDKLYIVGFSSYARQIKKEDLSSMKWDDFDPYTNMQHGFYLARKLLSKERCYNKQILLISDGEPTAHFEGESVSFQYPPSPRTLELTLKEVRHCTQKGITINAFMLESGRFLSGFVAQMARLNKGRVFYTKADTLGQYLLVDYISNRKKKI